MALVAFLKITGSDGPARLMWGSDWPVLNLAGDYANWAALTDDLIRHLSAEDQNRIWGSTARGLYRLH